jgi:hypothetical protein
MAQTTILAAAQTANNATDVTVTKDTPATISIFASSGAIPGNITIPVHLIVNGAIQYPPVYAFNARDNKQNFPAPGVYRVARPDISAWGINIGVALDQ